MTNQLFEALFWADRATGKYSPACVLRSAIIEAEKVVNRVVYTEVTVKNGGWTNTITFARMSRFQASDFLRKGDEVYTEDGYSVYDSYRKGDIVKKLTEAEFAQAKNAAEMAEKRPNLPSKCEIESVENKVCETAKKEARKHFLCYEEEYAVKALAAAVADENTMADERFADALRLAYHIVWNAVRSTKGCGIWEQVSFDALPVPDEVF